jgi:lipopolysaccharide transport system ATP-binding protein
MSDYIIRVENISKKYIIGENIHGNGIRTFRDIFDYKLKKIFSKEDRKHKIEDTTIWALKDVSFNVNEGEVVGIIGRNGAGKSTLLKILSRITEPTFGQIKLNGRVASLLEVGTGFNQELTGRENIYLNGSILGMQKTEVDKRFDEIVAFSEIEKFLDTPVKRYSSGMYVRLAFAVAAHLEQEILIVDEVLAVGDTNFQKKCLGKMKGLSKDGRTVLFVTHTLSAVQQMCNRCILINFGKVEKDDSKVNSVIKTYLLSNTDGIKSHEWTNPNGYLNNKWFVPTRVVLTDYNGTKLNMPVQNNNDIFIQVEGEVESENEKLAIDYFIYNEEDLLLYQSATHDEPCEGVIRFPKGQRKIRTKIPKRFLNEGEYRIELHVFLHGEKMIIHSGNKPPTIYLTIEGGLSDSLRFLNRRIGILSPVFRWDIE